jgi:hypothetical protein
MTDKTAGRVKGSLLLPNIAIIGVTERRDRRQGFAAQETNGTTWSSLAAIYHRQGRVSEEIGAWERATALLPHPAPELLALGYAELSARHARKALQAFEEAASSFSPGHQREAGSRFFASLAQGERWP